VESRSADVVVVGSGPAGWSAAYACSARGLDTLLVAPRPDAVWRPTYGLWADQRSGLPDGAASVVAETVWAAGRTMERAYAVLDNASVVEAYLRSGVRVVPGTVESATADHTGMRVGLRSGEHLAARVVVDASGEHRALCGGPAPGPRAEQTAYGVVVPAEAAAPVVRPGEAVFMDWSPLGPADEHATFLYAVPLPGDRVLLEETSLAARPGLPLDLLADRLAARLRAAGVPVDAAIGTETVRFRLDVPVPSPLPGVVAFGVAAGMMHPATGFSVGDALTTAPTLADAIAGELAHGSAAAARAARAVVWPARARGVRSLRDLGLRTLLRMPPPMVPAFFDAYFALSPERQRAYLSGRADLAGTAAAMTALFGSASWQVRGAMLAAQFRTSAPGERRRAGSGSNPGC
jgi:lycopene beta-cyclase